MSRNVVKLVLSLVVLILIFGAALLSQLGMLVFPFLVGTLAAVFVLENGEKRILSISLSVVAVAVDFIFNSYVSFSCLGAVVVAILIAIWFARGGSKGIYVAISTVLVSVLLIAFVFLAAIYELGSLDLPAASALILDDISAVREGLYDTLASFVTRDENGELIRLFADEVIYDTIDYYFSALPSVVVIVSLALVGIANKLFTFIVDRVLSGGRLGIGSTFRTPALFAYFFIFLSITQMFESDGSVFFVAMLNLYNVFLAVYAYVGFRFSTYFLGRRMNSPILAGIIILVLTLMLGGFSLQILSIVGTLETIAVARYEAKADEDKNDAGG